MVHTWHKLHMTLNSDTFIMLNHFGAFAVAFFISLQAHGTSAPRHSLVMLTPTQHATAPLASSYIFSVATTSSLVTVHC